MSASSAASGQSDAADIIRARVQAAGTSFYWAMRILPPARRDAMFAIYAFCREVDDIADSDAPPTAKRVELIGWRDEIDAIYAGRPSHLIGHALVAAVDEYHLRREDFLAMIDGMEMDVVADIRAPDFATLDLYCDRVASAVGRLSVRVFGMEKEAGLALAHHLGRALQLTNILRDIDEDGAIGRLYLPREALMDAGITSNEPATVLTNSAIGQVCAPVVARAEKHFAEAEAIMARSPRGAVKTPRIMAAAYRIYLDRMIARGWQAPRERVRLRRWQFLWILLRYAIV